MALLGADVGVVGGVFFLRGFLWVGFLFPPFLLAEKGSIETPLDKTTPFPQELLSPPPSPMIRLFPITFLPLFSVRGLGVSAFRCPLSLLPSRLRTSSLEMPIASFSAGPSLRFKTAPSPFPPPKNSSGPLFAVTCNSRFSCGSSVRSLGGWQQFLFPFFPTATGPPPPPGAGGHAPLQGPVAGSPFFAFHIIFNIPFLFSDYPSRLGGGVRGARRLLLTSSTITTARCFPPPTTFFF